MVPVCNNAGTLAELSERLVSTLEDCGGAFELVLIDDCSTDRSSDIAREYADRDPRVKVFRNEQNLGIVKSRNRAFAEADPRSDYFAVMDSDDGCMPTRLEHHSR